ncbi:lipocalin family protein [Mangrovibacterium sp.]|uniref:lipocalin family protein n=1 Tax=Mangrovibacterium sp. TaxID=1961364 RepID=UPI0035615A96
MKHTPCTISLIALLLLASCGAKTTIDTSTVAKVELDRYMGTWYEIARFQHSFEKDLIGVTARYEVRDDGKIKVENAGWKNTFDGEYKIAEGVAKIPNPAETGKLKVSFFLFFYADYNILELDTVNYSYALVGSSGPDYLWILGRKPQMPANVYQKLVNHARDRGYDVSRLYKVPQPEF